MDVYESVPPEQESQPHTPAARRRRLIKRLVVIAATLLVLGGLFGFVKWYTWYYPPTPFFGTQVAPRVTFDRYESEFDAAVVWLRENPQPRGYYTELPDQYAYLAAGGLVSEWGEAVFFPMWSGVPDDAGGYIYTTDESPEGWDLWGMQCANPIQMNENWWACNLSEEGGKLPRLDSNQ